MRNPDQQHKNDMLLRLKEKFFVKEFVNIQQILSEEMAEILS